MVRPERFELPTCCSGGNRSIQLSYGRTVSTVYMGKGNSINVGLQGNPREGGRSSSTDHEGRRRQAAIADQAELS